MHTDVRIHTVAGVPGPNNTRRVQALGRRGRDRVWVSWVPGSADLVIVHGRASARLRAVLRAERYALVGFAGTTQVWARARRCLAEDRTAA